MNSHEYKKNGKDIRQTYVNGDARTYADTYEEAVEAFNCLVDKRIEHYKETIAYLEGLKVK